MRAQDIINRKDNKSERERIIEFAKFHVEAALKAASNKATTNSEYIGSYGEGLDVDKKSILNAYPLTNIK